MKDMKYLTFLFSMSLFLQSCAPAPEDGLKSKISIRLPASVSQSPLRHLKMSSSRQAKVTSLNDIDCYAILISWNEELVEPSFPIGRCATSSGLEVLNIRQAEGGIADGGLLEFDMPSEVNAKFSVVGFTYNSANAGFCPFFPDLTLDELSIMGTPTIVGEGHAFVTGEFVEVPINISLDNPIGLADCKEGPFHWEQVVSTVGGAGIWGTSLWGSATWGP
jgi:hypothetical protein